jgi:hypothetical protein
MNYVIELIVLKTEDHSIVSLFEIGIQTTFQIPDLFSFQGRKRDSRELTDPSRQFLKQDDFRYQVWERIPKGIMVKILFWYLNGMGSFGKGTDRIVPENDFCPIIGKKDIIPVQGKLVSKVEYVKSQEEEGNVFPFESQQRCFNPFGSIKNGQNGDECHGDKQLA